MDELFAKNNDICRWHSGQYYYPSHNVSRLSVEKADGIWYWYYDGELHREDGPAIYPDGKVKGGEYWYKHGKLHRENGPAIILFNGDEEWWIEGNKIPNPGYNIKRAIE